ncbi:glutathione S-transferase family protein [Rhodopila sp.]|uniref:glutathione S-transferase family protein n=1 Tax=Rhodopila sp. TaxID=2480087 RepID=UPI003D0EFC08
MTLTIYGSPRSRTMRVLWAAAELKLEYEHVPLAFDDAALKTPDFLRVNPAGAVPTIVDDGFALSESLAINLYLAKKYSSVGAEALYPSDSGEEADVWRWTLWAQGHLEPWVQQDALLAELRRATWPHAQEAIKTALGVLDRVLTGKNWLASRSFTVGDLNVASVLSPSRARHLNLVPYRHVSDWLKRCYDRPAAVATRHRFSG